MSKRFWIILFIALLGAGGLVYLRHTREAAGSAGGRPGAAGGGGGRRGGGGPGGDMPVPVIAGVVEERDVPIYLDGLGTVQAFNTVTVRARVDGQIDKVAFTEGQDVKEGDLLALIDPRPYQASLDQALAKKAQDEAQFSNARATLKRDEDLINKKVLDQQSYDTQRFLVDQLAATVKGDEAAVDNARTQLDYTRITAPLAGRVGVRLVDQGNIIHAGDAGGVVVITQVRPISVLFTLPEQNLQLIREQGPSSEAQNQMKVVAMGRDQKNRIADGVLAVIDNVIDQTTGTIKLKATFQNDDLRLWPGEFVNARLLLTTRERGLTVPASVVQRGPKGSYVFVIKDDKTVDTRPVKVAQTEDGVALLDDGVKAGERVVVDGQYKLQPGSKVTLTNENGDKPGGEGGHKRLGDQPKGDHKGRDAKAAPTASPAVAARQ